MEYISKIKGINYSVGQYVMAQENRPKNPANIKYCIGMITKINNNNTFVIKFNNGKERTLTNNYFYTNVNDNLQEKLNFKNKLETNIQIGSAVLIIKKKENYNHTINIHNLTKNTDILILKKIFENIEYCTVKNININNNTVIVKKFNIIVNGDNELIFKYSGTQTHKLDKIISKSCYTQTFNLFFEYHKTKNNKLSSFVEIDEKDEESEEPSIENNCKNLKRFDSYGFMIKNRKIFGISLLVLSITSFLIIINKHSISTNLNSFSSIINKVINVLLTLISLFLIIMLILLFKKSWFSPSKLIIYVVILALCIFMFYMYRNTNSKYIHEFFTSTDNSMNKVIKIMWAVISSFSVSPVYMLLFMVFIIPNYLLRLLHFDKYQINFMNYIHGKIPVFLSPLLYLLILISFLGLYFYIQTYCFSEYILMPTKYSKYYDYTTSFKYRVKQLLNGIKKFIKEHLFTIVFIVAVIAYYTVRKLLGHLINFTLITLLIIIIVYIIIKYVIGGSYKMIKHKLNEIKKEKKKIDDTYNDIKDSLDTKNTNTYIM